MNVLTSAVWALGLLAVCSAHLCLISPHQRGGINGLNTAGSSDCILLQAPCGGRAKETPKVTWNMAYEVIFQKNLDHWLKTHPGYFDINLWDNANMHKTLLTRVKDTGENSLHIYTANGTLPKNLANGNYVLQVDYVTNNVDAPAMFYQCADIMIHH